MAGQRCRSYAGRLLGPAINLLPEDREDLPEIVPVEWLNLGSTMYRREVLPSPPFSTHFTGYSLMEDVNLSATVGRKWKLLNARTARIFHDTQPGSHKSDLVALAEMELVNRHYIMTKTLNRTGVLDYFRLFVWEAFQIVVAASRSSSRSRLFSSLRGKARALTRLRF